MAKPYVGDVFDIDSVIKEHGNKIFLIAGVGSGKSTWVKDILTKKGNVLFITSRKAKVEEDVHCSCFKELFQWHTNNQTLVTNSKLCAIVERVADDYLNDLDDFLGHYDYVVIDEVHSIVTDSTFAESSYGLFSFMEYAADGRVPVIAMTGTPEPISEYFEENGWHIIDYRDTCRYVHPAKIVLSTKRSIWTRIETNYGINKIVYFSNSTEGMIGICDQLLKKGKAKPEEIALIVSKSREKEFGDRLVSKLTKPIAEEVVKASKLAYESIVTDNVIPEGCKILLSTSTLREGVDIMNEDVVMICENHILSNLIQFFGRIRQESNIAYVIEDAPEHRVKHYPLLFEYAVAEECQAANQFLRKRIMDPYNPFEKIERHVLIEYLTGKNGNPYIYYDYIASEFRVFHLKYKEEIRVINTKFWKENLLVYCDDNNITVGGCRDLRKYMKDGLIRLVEMDMKLFETEKKTLFNMLKWAYKIEARTPSKINENFKQLGIPWLVISKRENSGSMRNKTYWKLIKSE